MKENQCNYPNCVAPGRIDENGTIHHGFVLNNGDNQFPDMGEGKWMHLECYIRHVVNKAVEERK